MISSNRKAAHEAILELMEKSSKILKEIWPEDTNEKYFVEFRTYIICIDRITIPKKYIPQTIKRLKSMKEYLRGCKTTGGARICISLEDSIKSLKEIKS